MHFLLPQFPLPHPTKPPLHFPQLLSSSFLLSAKFPMINGFQTEKAVPTERRALMLKDFLLQDDSHSCSSTGFNSFPRRPSSNAHNSSLLQQNHSTSRTLGPASTLPRFQRSRSRPRAAAEAAISTLQKLLNAVNSRSRKKPPKKEQDAEIVVQVRVKDILRWRSLKELIDGHDEEDKSQPLDYSAASPPVRSGSDDTAGPIRVVGGRSVFTIEEEGEKENVGGEDPMMTGAGTALYTDHVGPTKIKDFVNEDEERHSPVSVLDSPFRDDEDSFSSFDQTLANVERTKERLLESIKWFENLAGVKPINSEEDDLDMAEDAIEEDEENMVEEAIEEDEEKANRAESKARGSTVQSESNADHDHFPFDFYMDEHKINSSCHKDVKHEARVAKDAKACLSGRGECFQGKEFEGMEELDEHVGEAEKEAQWSKFEDQQNQLAAELEVGMFSALLYELVFNLAGGSDGSN